MLDRVVPFSARDFRCLRWLSLKDMSKLPRHAPNAKLASMDNGTILRWSWNMFEHVPAPRKGCPLNYSPEKRSFGVSINHPDWGSRYVHFSLVFISSSSSHSPTDRRGSTSVQVAA